MQTTHAGAVVFQTQNEQTRFLLISSSSGLHWVLPKGHIEPGESAEDAALRELQEEAGVVGEIKAVLGIQRYLKGHKDVTAQYYLVRALGTVDALEGRTLRWEDSVEAMRLLSFEEARQALQEGVVTLSHAKTDNEMQ